jgi:hypothetical protein
VWVYEAWAGMFGIIGFCVCANLWFNRRDSKMISNPDVPQGPRPGPKPTQSPDSNAVGSILDPVGNRERQLDKEAEDRVLASIAAERARQQSKADYTLEGIQRAIRQALPHAHVVSMNTTMGHSHPNGMEIDLKLRMMATQQTPSDSDAIRKAIAVIESSGPMSFEGVPLVDPIPVPGQEPVPEQPATFGEQFQDKFGK